MSRKRFMQVICSLCLVIAMLLPMASQIIPVHAEGEEHTCSFTNYVADNNATSHWLGTETAVCTNGCGAKDTRDVEPNFMDMACSCHIYEYDLSGFTFLRNDGSGIYQEDTDGNGTLDAVVVDVANVSSNPSNYLVTDSANFFLKYKRYNNAGTSITDNTGCPTPVALAPLDIIADEKYHLYSGELTIYSGNDHNQMLQLFNTNNIREKEEDGYTTILSDLKAKGLAGKSLDIYLSMKVDGDVTGTTGMPTYYFNKIIVVDQEALDAIQWISDGDTKSYTCTCGVTTIIPPPSEEEEHTCSFTNYVADNNATTHWLGTETATCDVEGCEKTQTRDVEPDFMDMACSCHIYEYDLSGFEFLRNDGTGVYKEDTDGNGTLDAVVVDVANVSSNPSNYLVTDSVNFILKYKRYNNAGTSITDNTACPTPVALAPSDIIADEKYHLYSGELTIYSGNNHNQMLQLFNTNNIREKEEDGYTTILSDLKAKGLADKSLAIYLSMKVTGDVTGTNGMPTYRFNKIIVVDQEALDAIQWTSDGDTKSYTCTCGVTTTLPIHKEVEEHTCTFTNYIADNNATTHWLGSETATCDVEGCEKTQTRDVESDFMDMACSCNVYEYDLSGFEFLRNDGRGIYKEDTDGNGTLDAVVVDVANVSSTPGNYLVTDAANFFLRYKRYNNAGTSITNDTTCPAPVTLTPSDIIADEKYHLYSGELTIYSGNDHNQMLQLFNTNNIREKEEDGYTTILSDLKAKGLADKSLAIYLSVKVKGDVTGATGKPTYYFNKIIVVDQEAMDAIQWTFNNDASCTSRGTKSATCPTCQQVTTMPNKLGGFKHSFTEYTSMNNAEGNFKGTEKATCECGATHERTVDLDLTDMQIAVPEVPTDVENSAATELATYVQKMTGKRPVILSESLVTGDAVYIGATQFAEANKDKITVPDSEFDEGWAIVAIDHNLVLTGEKTRGVLYAVYHLLEDVLGVHWWNFWEEYVPNLTMALVPNDINSSGKPAFDYRDIHVSSLIWRGDEIPFFARNRLNGWAGSISAAYGGQEDTGAPTPTHSFNKFIPAYWSEVKNQDPALLTALGHQENYDYFVEHPEWFSWNDAGQMRTSGQLCLTNEGLIAAFAEKLKGVIQYSYAKADAAGEARPRYFCVAPNDVSSLCKCDDCEASAAQYGASGYLLEFVNKLAAAIEDEYPEVLIDTIAYLAYLEPPKGGMKPADNVVVRVAINYKDILHSINHANNAKMLDVLEGWAEVCPEGGFYIWDYGTLYLTNGVVPTMHHYGEDYSTYLAMGMDGCFLELEDCVVSDFWDMKVWLNAKLMEDPTQDMETLMDEFIYGYYGAEAGVYVEAYLDYMNERSKQATGHYQYYTEIINAEWLTVEDVLKGNACFDQAFAAAGDNQTLLKRLRAARSGLDRVIIHNYDGLALEAIRASLDFPLSQEESAARVVESLTELSAERRYDDNVATMLTLYEKYLGEEPLPAPPETWPATDLPEELADVDPAHIYDFPATEFNLLENAELLADSQSDLGQAAVFDISKWEDKSKYEMAVQQNLSVRIRYTNKTTTLLKNIMADELIVGDGEYHLYKIIDNASPLESVTKTEECLYLFRSMALECAGFAETLMAAKKHKVDAYISMRVDGDITCTTEDYPVYSIDRIILVTKHDTAGFVENHDATCLADGTESGFCPICQKNVDVTIPRTKRAHLYENYIFDNNATESFVGTQTASCEYGCGTTKTIPYGAKDPEDDLAKVHKKHIYEYTAEQLTVVNGQVLDDPDSVTGKAAVYDLGYFITTLGKTEDYLQSYFAIGDGQTLPLAFYSGLNDDNNVPSETLLTRLSEDDLIVDGKYHLYKVEDFELKHYQKYLYMFRDWTLQSPDVPADMLYPEGKKVDFYLSMKITGDISCKDMNNLPVYSIDRMIVTDSCDVYVIEWTAKDEATCTSDATEKGKCFVCGEQTVRSVEGTKLDHSFTTKASDIKATDATCKAAATYYVQCDNCDAVSDTKTVSVGGVADHSFNEKASDIKATDASCTAAATYYVQCDNCDAVSVSETVAVGGVSGHSFTDKASDVKAFGGNCTVGAIHYIQCDSCDSISTTRCIIVGEPKGHNVVNGACTECDYEELYITKQPADVTKKLGTNAVFNVSATGEGLTYQWQYRTGSSGTWKNASATGNKTAKLTVPATASRDDYQYRCKVTDGAGNAVYTKVVTLNVFGITTQPKTVTQKLGAKAVFTAGVVGDDVTYQWQYRVGSNGTWKTAAATGNKTAKLTVSATASRDGYQYRCKVTDGDGNIAYTNAATLNVFGITAQPKTVTQNVGTKAVFSVEVIGEDVTYQWQYRTSASGTWKNTTATGNKTANLTVPVTESRAGYQYRCVVKDQTGLVINSNIATLKVK